VISRQLRDVRSIGTSSTLAHHRLGSRYEVTCWNKLPNELVKKLLMRYGASTALAVRDTSGVERDWSLVVDELKTRLDLAQNPYGAIPAYLKWLLNNALCLIRLLHLRQMGLVVGELSLSYSKGKPTEAGLICQTHPAHWRYKR